MSGLLYGLTKTLFSEALEHRRISNLRSLSSDVITYQARGRASSVLIPGAHSLFLLPMASRSLLVSFYVRRGLQTTFHQVGNGRVKGCARRQ